MSLVSTATQGIISLYSAWERCREDEDGSDMARGAFQGPQQHTESPYSSSSTKRRGSLERTLLEPEWEP